MNKNVPYILIGMKHSGKSTIGNVLAKKTNRFFYDTDNVITERCGKTPRELFDEGGSLLMKEHETNACRYLAALTSPMVIATGGALAENPEGFAAFKDSGLLIYLDAPFNHLYSRILQSAQRDGRLPKFLEGNNPEEKFRELFMRRSAIYDTIADIHIKTNDMNPDEIVQTILTRMSNEK